MGDGVEAAATVPAAIGQRLLWVLEQFRGEDGAANCPIVLRLQGPLDEELLVTGLDALTARHQSLRTTFDGRGRHLTQIVHHPHPAPLGRVDLGRAPDPQEALDQAVLDEIRQPIDAREWPVRTTLWRLGTDDHALCLNMHHLVTDGWSCGLVLRDLERLTRPGGPDGSQPRLAPLPPVRWQFPQFARWQHDWLAGPEAQADRAYWTEHLAGVRLPEVPLRPAREAGARLTTASRRADLDRATVDRLQQVAHAHRTTLPPVMLAVYGAAMHRLTGQDELAVASFLSNRARAEVRETVGLLANMVVLRTPTPTGSTMSDLIAAAHGVLMDAFVHQGFPYQLLPADVVTRGDRRSDDVVFQMIPRPGGHHRVAGATARAAVVETLGTRFECELQLYPDDAGLGVLLVYNAARLDGSWADSLLDSYTDLATGLAAGRLTTG